MNQFVEAYTRACSTLAVCLCCFLLYLPTPLSAGDQVTDTLTIHLEKQKREIFPLVNLNWAPAREMTVALALSGGGARGLAHIGVLKAFEENKIPVNLIVGTSMGSIVGGFYAAGFSAKEIQKIVGEIDWNSIFADRTYRSQLLLSQKQVPQRHLLQLRLDGFLPIIPSAITQGQIVFQTLYNKFLRSNYQAATHFDRLKIPFRAVATDLVTGRRVVLEKGDLAEAINASLALPLIFSPVEIDSMLLADGGITENLPVDAARESGGDIVLAVDVSSPLRSRDHIGTVFEVADQVTSIMMAAVTQANRDHADVLISPDLGGVKGADFVNAAAIIDSGYAAAIRAIPQIRQTIRQARQQRESAGKSLGTVRRMGLNGVPLEMAEELENQLFTGPGRALFEQDVIEDLRFIYSRGIFSDVTASIYVQGDSSDISISAIELPLVDELIFEHRNVLPDSLFEAISLSHRGSVLNMKQLFDDLHLLRNTLVEQGYSLADIGSVRFNQADQSLRIRLDEGVIGKIEIIGNKVTRDPVITRELSLKEGDLFRGPIAAKAIQDLYTTNLFDRVRLSLKRDQQENVLQIRVKERLYYLMRLGAHYDLDRKVDAFVELVAENFLGTATRGSLFGMTGDHSRRAELVLSTVRLFTTYWTAQARFYLNERTERYYADFERLPDYRITRKGGRLSLGQQIARLGLISAELRLEDVSLESSDPEFRFAGAYQVRSIILNSVVDKRDKLPFPENGIYNRWAWEAGTNSLLGSDVTFTKVSAGLEGYYPLHPRLNVHPFLFGGTADLTLPFSEYFFLGGANSFPGTHELELFGRQFVQAGSDLRLRLSQNVPFEVYTQARYTTGATWEQPETNISSADFLHSISFSLIINSLLGPLQFTYGKVLGGVDKLHFSFGFDF